MKTNDRITLCTDTSLKYNPAMGDYENSDGVRWKVPCKANFISKSKQLREFGEINERLVVVRFMQEQEPFDYALFHGEKYKPMDSIDAPIKGSITMRRVYE